MTTKILYSRAEAARLLSISERAVSYAIEQDRLDVTKVGRRSLIHKDELLRFGKHSHPSFCL